ncbi:MAG TPA: DUF1565 domain-containing protein [Candidatus Acidoferrales bacterium]|nr:DUF1565 domain-containing protein [Candidatus Acidoferrales bacterium]
MSWPSRVFFAVVAAVAVAGLWSAVGCTRRGNNSPAPPTPTPQTNYYVNPATGNDSTGNGTPSAPYRSITKALSVVAKSAIPNLTVNLAAGSYTTGSGEVFPIVIPTGVTIAGVNTGSHNPRQGTFIAGYGEDVNLEKATGAAPKTYFTTMEVPAGISATVDGVYVGPRLAPGYSVHYAAFDVLGSLSASHASFGAGVPSGRIEGGVIVPSGTLSCNACVEEGHKYAIEALTIPSATSGPTLNLSGQSQQSIVGGDITGILTDGTASLTVSNQTFQSKMYGYRDTLAQPTAYPSSTPTSSPTPYPSGSSTPPPYGVSVDFGKTGGSSGGNVFIGPASTIVAEIFVSTPGEVVTAFGNTWNPNTQCSNPSGQYPKYYSLPSAKCSGNGKNVTVAAGSGASVEVGPLLQPTPTPYYSPTPTPSPSS